MAEEITITPVAPPAINRWIPYYIGINTDEWSITLSVRSNTGVQRTERAMGLQAEIRALNKANLTNNTLMKRVMNYFITNGYFATGVVSGVPD